MCASEISPKGKGSSYNGVSVQADGRQKSPIDFERQWKTRPRRLTRSGSLPSILQQIEFDPAKKIFQEVSKMHVLLRLPIQ